MESAELPPIRGRDRNWSWAFSGSYFILAAMIVPIMVVMPVGDVAFMALGFAGFLFLLLAIQHATTTLTYTPTTIRCTHALDVLLNRRADAAAPVRLDLLTEVSYYVFRDMELRLVDAEGNIARIEVSTRWPRVDEWGSLIRLWAGRRGVELTDVVLDVLARGGARWIDPG